MDPLQTKAPSQASSVEQRLKHSTQKLSRILRRCEEQKRVPRAQNPRKRDQK